MGGLANSIRRKTTRWKGPHCLLFPACSLNVFSISFQCLLKYRFYRHKFVTCLHRAYICIPKNFKCFYLTQNNGPFHSVVFLLILLYVLLCFESNKVFTKIRSWFPPPEGCLPFPLEIELLKFCFCLVTMLASLQGDWKEEIGASVPLEYKFEKAISP